jgi:hypothetical protein
MSSKFTFFRSADQMWRKFPGLRMKNEMIFSNSDQKSGYDSKKTVCSTIGHPGCEYRIPATRISRPPAHPNFRVRGSFG